MTENDLDQPADQAGDHPRRSISLLPGDGPDRRDFDALDLAPSDGTCNYSSTPGVPDMLFRDYLTPSTKARSGFANHSHQITNILINGPTATARGIRGLFHRSLQTVPKDGWVTEHLWRGRYLDRWSQRDGRWAIDHRQVVFDSYTPTDCSRRPPERHAAGPGPPRPRRPVLRPPGQRALKPVPIKNRNTKAPRHQGTKAELECLECPLG